jgi:hypothetical protein
MGFGNPQEHIYLSLNLATQQRQFKERKSNGRSHSKSLPPTDE